MDATRIIAIRHGETAWNVDSRLQGHLDIPLNDVGLWQARQAALALADEPIDAIYSSDLQRAWVTARAIAETTQAPLTAHQGLRERSFGVLQGHTFEELEAKEPEQAYRWRKRDPAFAPAGAGAFGAVGAAPVGAPAGGSACAVSHAMGTPKNSGSKPCQAIASTVPSDA